jgi:tetratricopeptide (TPR) repeat protein
MRLLVGCAAFAAAGLIVCSAGAQQKPQQRSGVTFSLDKSRNAAADGAHAKAAAGDCKAALDLYDEALRHSVDPTLYRDRGMCHDKLGNVYPAIDDYRAYLSQSPNAPDYDKIRQRLDDLIKSSSQDIGPTLGHGGTFDSEMRGGMLDGSTPVQSKPKDKDTKDDDDKNTDKDKEPSHAKDDKRPLTAIEYEEDRDKQANKGAMRKGTGFVIGAYLYPRYVANPWSFGFGQGVGVRAGYALNSWSSLSLELGYMAQLSSGEASRADGFTTMFAWEMRFPFDRWADNQFVFSVGGGYENLTNSLLGQAYASFVARGRAGWRHVFGPSFALDILADGGFMGTAPINAPSGTQSFGVGGFVGGIVAISVGF